MRSTFLAVFVAAVFVAVAFVAAGCSHKTGPPNAPGAAAGDGATQSAGKSGLGDMNEEYLKTRMEQIGPGSQALRKALESRQAQDATKQAQQLAELFGEVEKFWAFHKKPDATKWAQEARKLAAESAGAATAGNLEKATAAANGMGGDCKQCHAAYREGTPETGFRIKRGVLQSGQVHRVKMLFGILTCTPTLPSTSCVIATSPATLVS
jgi:cytochrome c556